MAESIRKHLACELSPCPVTLALALKRAKQDKCSYSVWRLPSKVYRITTLTDGDADHSWHRIYIVFADQTFIGPDG